MSVPSPTQPPSVPPTPLKVAIVGAGPAGLTLAAILHHTSKSAISCTVYELEPSPHSRIQGSMLDVHKHSGQLALSKAGLLEEFKKHMMVDATEFYLRESRDGKVRMHHTEEGEEDPERPEIDRGVLRRILLDGVPSDSVKWGKKVNDVELIPSSSGPGTTTQKVKLCFSDGTTSSDDDLSDEGLFDVVVGADGTFSRIRRSSSLYLNPTPPPYTGITCLWSSISSLDTLYPHLSKYVGNGSCMALNEECTNCMMSQKNGDGSVKTMFFIPVDVDSPEWKVDWTLKTKGGLREALGEMVEELMPEWNKEAKDLVRLCDEGQFAVKPLYQFPPGKRWEKKVPCVTLLGDAAHVLTPFTGVGVNLAMHDAYELSVALEKVVSGTSTLSLALGEFEETMMQRAGIHAQRTIRNQKTFLGGGGIDDAIEKMKLILSMAEK